jgi:hypothetical protein
MNQSPHYYKEDIEMVKFHAREVHVRKFHITNAGIALCNIAVAIGLSLTVSAESAHADELHTEMSRQRYEAAQASIEAHKARLVLEKKHITKLTAARKDTRRTLSKRTNRAGSIKIAAKNMVKVQRARQAAAEAAAARAAAAATAARPAYANAYARPANGYGSSTTTYAHRTASRGSSGSYGSYGSSSRRTYSSRSAYAAPRSSSRGVTNNSVANHSVARTCTTNGQPAACQGAVNGGGLVRIQAGSSQSNITLYAAHNNAGGAWIQGVSNGQSVKIGGQSYKAVSTQHISTSNPYLATKSGQVWLQTCEKDGKTMKEVLLQRK